MQKMFEDLTMAITDENYLKEISWITQKITDILLLRARIQKIPADQKNKLLLAGVNFYLDYNEEQQAYYLKSNAHPSQWDAKRMSYIIDDMEKYMLENISNF